MDLTICIPTYNRRALLLGLLDNLLECKSNSLRILISDNSSDEEVKLSIEDLVNYQKVLNIKFFEQARNIGLRGNYEFLLSQVETKYVWFLGDDDRVSEDILTLLSEKLIVTKKSFIFLNYTAFTDIVSNVVRSFNVLTLIKGNYEDIWKEYTTGLMFISCQVMRTDFVKRKLMEFKEPLAFPLGFALTAIRNNDYDVVQSVTLYDRYGNASWSSSKRDVFLVEVPAILGVMSTSVKQKRLLLYYYFRGNPELYVFLWRSGTRKIYRNHIVLLGMFNIDLAYRVFRKYLIDGRN